MVFAGKVAATVVLVGAYLLMALAAAVFGILSGLAHGLFHGGAPE